MLVSLKREEVTAMNPIDWSLSCHHCKKELVLTSNSIKTVRFRSQPGFGYNVVTCTRCRFYVELPPMLAVEQAEKLGCQVVWRDGCAPLDLIEAFEAEYGIRVLTIRPLCPKDEAYVAFFGYILDQSLEDPFDDQLRLIV